MNSYRGQTVHQCKVSPGLSELPQDHVNRPIDKYNLILLKKTYQKSPSEILYAVGLLGAKLIFSHSLGKYILFKNLEVFFKYSKFSSLYFSDNI